MAVFFFFFSSGGLTAPQLRASFSREQAEPAVGCSGPRWVKHMCHNMKAVLLGKGSKLPYL